MIIPSNCESFDKFCLFLHRNKNRLSNVGTELVLHNELIMSDIAIPTSCVITTPERVFEANLERFPNNYEHQKHYYEWNVSCDEDTFQSICECNFNKEGHISIFTWAFGNWVFYQNKKIRNRSTIYLPKKNDIYEDLENFFHSKSKYEYLQIPHTRLYLLEGLPGTGKTSIIHSLASEYNYSICILELESISHPSELKKAVKDLPIRSFVVIEDIDTLFSEDRMSNTKVSFSLYINILDGLVSQDNFVCFATTNHIKKLDIAIKRRMDRIYSFSYAEADQIIQFGLTREDAQKITKHKTTVNIVQKFLLKGGDLKDFSSFNQEYMEVLHGFNSMFL